MSTVPPNQAFDIRVASATPAQCSYTIEGDTVTFTCLEASDPPYAVDYVAYFTYEGVEYVSDPIAVTATERPYTVLFDPFEYWENPEGHYVKRDYLEDTRRTYVGEQLEAIPDESWISFYYNPYGSDTSLYLDVRPVSADFDASAASEYDDLALKLSIDFEDMQDVSINFGVLANSTSKIVPKGDTDVWHVVNIQYGVLQDITIPVKLADGDLERAITLQMRSVVAPSSSEIVKGRLSCVLVGR